MIRIKPIELSDKPWFEKLCRAENSRSADYSFGTTYMWDVAYKQKIAQLGDRLIITPGYCGNPFFAFPVGSGELKGVIEEMHACASSKRIPFRMRGVTMKHKAILEEMYPDKFKFIEDRAQHDYIYLAEKLATMAGKKLHAKRNHINRFVENNNWSFTPMTADLTPVCLELLDKWTEESGALPEKSLDFEHEAIERGLRNFDYLGLEGGVLWSENDPIAFTMGERISTDTFVVHFEKAFADIQGAYPMTTREFVRQIMAEHPDIVYINREDDMGKENLRKAKLSFYPEFLVEKHTAVWKSEDHQR